MSMEIIFHYLKNFLLKTNLSQSTKYLLLTCIKYYIVYLRKSWKTFFKTRTNYYNTLNVLIFSKRNVKYGLQTMSYIGPKICDLVPKEVKQITTLNKLRAKIKVWKLENCRYWLFRIYLPQTGFITKRF